MSLHHDKFKFLQHKAIKNTSANMLQLPFVYYENCYHTDTSTIEPTGYVKDLGIIISDDVSFTLHINTIATTARQKM